MLERFIGMLSGKGGRNSDRIGVELYFKSLEGLLRSIEEFNFKEVKKDVAEDHANFGKLMSDVNDELSLSKELNSVFSEKQAAKMDHFFTLGALMLAHANLVVISHEDEDCNKYIAKIEGQVESDKKEIELKHAVIESMKTKAELEEEKQQLLQAKKAFQEQDQAVNKEIADLKTRIDNFEDEYFAAL